GVLLTGIVGTIAIAVREAPSYRVGQRLLDVAVARVDFTAIDQAETRDARKNAYDSVPNIYVHNEQLFDRLNNRIQELAALADQESFSDLRQEALEGTKLDRDSFDALRRLFAEDAQRAEELRKQYVRQIFTKAFLSESRFEVENVPYNRFVLLHPDPAPEQNVDAELLRTPRVLWPVTDREQIENSAWKAAKDYPRDLKPVIVELTLQAMQGPTYRFAPERTEAARIAARESVEPRTRSVEAGSVLVEAGAALTPPQLDLLEAEQEAYESSVAAWKRTVDRLGHYGMVGLVVLGMWGYLLGYYRRVAENPMRGLAVTALMLLAVGIAVSVARFEPQLLYGALGFAGVLAAMIFSIAYDQRFALAVGGTLAVLLLIAMGLSVPTGVTLLTGVFLAAALLREVRTRSKLVIVGLYSGVGMAIAALLTGFAERPLVLDGVLDPGDRFVFERVLLDAGVGAIAGLIAGFVVQGILPAIEKLFRVTTAMTLKELNDASHPLLQRLAQEAPGTYQHSLRIADMAESAAEAIGADALACRVGAMYHDIGKMNKPAYFIENQGGGPNRHEKLSPAMSLLIIVGHVKDGVEMAREYNLPRVIRHFIESHHGTSLVQYFYHAAKKKTQTAGQPGPSEFEFRYPGPKPQTREAAIMLLCDGIESAARTIEEPTPVRLEQLVHTIATGRLMDGQFDECNLTLTELASIEAAITKTLCAVYHRRIKYPQAESTSSPQASTPSPAAVTA
ncbi:MAG: HD family phosphohydrolase, partial [Phycisphaeraceae bacterium]